MQFKRNSDAQRNSKNAVGLLCVAVWVGGWGWCFWYLVHLSTFIMVGFDIGPLFITSIHALWGVIVGSEAPADPRLLLVENYIQSRETSESRLQFIPIPIN